MTEILVVIGIIVLLAYMVAPAVNAMWEQRKTSETETLIRGALMTARNRALDNVETGLLFVLDSGGRQRIYTIERDDEPASARYDDQDNLKYNSVPAQIPDVPNQVISRDRFRIVPGNRFTLSPPMRVTPSYAVLPAVVDFSSPEGKAESFLRFSDAELANNDFQIPNDPDLRQEEKFEPQRHRNFFSVVFSTEGQLLIGRDVLVYDEDTQTDAGGDPGRDVGDLTGLRVVPVVTRYLVSSYDRDSNGRPVLLYPPDKDATLVHLLTVNVEGPGDVAVNFPSVRGLLVYDNRQFEETPKALKRQFLLDTGRPYYIGIATGDIIRGPLGENASPEQLP